MLVDYLPLTVHGSKSWAGMIPGCGCGEEKISSFPSKCGCVEAGVCGCPVLA